MSNPAIAKPEKGQPLLLVDGQWWRYSERDHLASSLECWTGLTGVCLAAMWMKTIQQDLKFNNLSLNEAIDVVIIMHSGDW